MENNDNTKLSLFRASNDLRQNILDLIFKPTADNTKLKEQIKEQLKDINKLVADS